MKTRYHVIKKLAQMREFFDFVETEEFSIRQQVGILDYFNRFLMSGRYK
jgi:hypothetical protein